MYCGKHIQHQLTQCPYCREAVTEVRIEAPRPIKRGGEVRRGLLFAFMAIMIQYFVDGYGAWIFPIPVDFAVRAYLVPLLFLGGLGLAVHGFILRVRA
jgi:hypothetical protein